MYVAHTNRMEYFHVDDNIPFCLYVHHPCLKTQTREKTNFAQFPLSNRERVNL